MATLADVLASGEGVERPFQCEAHDDNSASASVNVLKGVWCCYACGAAGTVDGKKVPSTTDVELMLAPDDHVRVYPEAYLELFANDLGNWPTRFTPWIRWHSRLGCDPLTGDATFPVHSPRGLLAGVGRRIANPSENQQRYAYPPRWSASRSVFQAGMPHDIVVLGEGAGDAVSFGECGAYGFGLYGSGLHKPQVELVMRSNPKLVLIATDADDAGEKGAARAMDDLSTLVECARVDWSELGVKDGAELPLEVRRDHLLKTVSGSRYVRVHDLEAAWTVQRTRIQAAFHQASVEG